MKKKYIIILTVLLVIIVVVTYISFSNNKNSNNYTIDNFDKNYLIIDRQNTDAKSGNKNTVQNFSIDNKKTDSYVDMPTPYRASLRMTQYDKKEKTYYITDYAKSTINVINESAAISKIDVSMAKKDEKIEIPGLLVTKPIVHDNKIFIAMNEGNDENGNYRYGIRVLDLKGNFIKDVLRNYDVSQFAVYDDYIYA